MPENERTCKKMKENDRKCKNMKEHEKMKEDNVRHADDGSNGRVFSPVEEKARNHPNLHLVGFTASPKFPTARMCISQMSFSFLVCSKSDIFSGLNFVAISHNIFLKKNNFWSRLGEYTFETFLCFFFVFFFLCFSLLFL